MNTSTTIMAREIAEQPTTVANTLEWLHPLRRDLARLTAGRNHVVLAGRGTSDNAATYGRYLCEIHAGRPAGLVAPSVGTHYQARIDLGDTVMVSLSQSGRTAEIVETQAWSRKHGAATIAITNDADSDLAEQADLALITAAGRERAVPATKTYTAQLAALAVLADSMAPGHGLVEQLRLVPDRIAEMLAADLDIDTAARMLAAADSGTVVLGRGITQTTALETGLKLEETCLRPVRSLSSADFDHGPKAVLDDRLTTVVLAPPGGTVLRGLTELARRIRSTGAPVLGIGGDENFADACTHALPGADLPELLSPIELIVTAQRVVEATARQLGMDPDQPRGLTKVTQTGAWSA